MKLPTSLKYIGKSVEDLIQMLPKEINEEYIDWDANELKHIRHKIVIINGRYQLTMDCSRSVNGESEWRAYYNCENVYVRTTYAYDEYRTIGYLRHETFNDRTLRGALIKLIEWLKKIEKI